MGAVGELTVLSIDLMMIDRGQPAQHLVSDCGSPEDSWRTTVHSLGNNVPRSEPSTLAASKSEKVERIHL